MPRSPSRDVSDRHDRSRGYFHRAGKITRLKLWLALAGLTLVAAWAVVDVRYPTLLAQTHSPGDLAAAHAGWDSQCSVCHVEFSVQDVSPLSLFRAGQRWQSVTCKSCHEGAAHQANVDREGEEFHARCANCHQEHGGRGRSLRRVSDQHCVRCHENLPAHRVGDGHVSPTVTGFSRDHPEFRPLGDQQCATGHKPRTLKFSHGLHMTPGLVYRSGARGSWTLTRLAQLAGDEVALRYQKPGQSLDSPVSLDCSSCHSTDLASSGNRPGPRTDGAYYQPVRYDAHCKACHPIRGTTMVSGTAVVPAFDLPHGVQPARLIEPLAGEYARRLLDGNNPAAAIPLGPGGRFDARADPTLATFRDEIDRLAAAAVSVLVPPIPASNPAARSAPGSGAGCAKCHDLAPALRGSSLPTVVPIATPAVWFPGARVNHVAHRGVSCERCHPGTTAAEFGSGWTSEKEPIRIAGIASCRECHGPPRTAVEVATEPRQSGGVKHGCTDCHTYHNGCGPLQGKGARGRNPARP